MQNLTYRTFVAADAIAVSQVALEAWRFTYQAIYEEAFIASFVQTHYAPGRLAALVPQVQAGRMFFHVALHLDRIIGYCHLGLTPPGAELFRLYLHPLYIGCGIGWGLLQQGEAFVRASTARYRAALDTVERAFSEMPRVTFPSPRAAFYAFFAVDGVTDSYAFAEEVLRRSGVGLAPGAAFGPQGEGYLRLCFAADESLLERALDQMRPLLC